MEATLTSEHQTKQEPESVGETEPMFKSEHLNTILPEHVSGDTSHPMFERAPNPIRPGERKPVPHLPEPVPDHAPPKFFE